jgi:hypothetical protein
VALLLLLLFEPMAAMMTSIKLTRLFRGIGSGFAAMGALAGEFANRGGNDGSPNGISHKFSCLNKGSIPGKNQPGIQL